MQKILLYYKFVSLSDAESVKLWQKTLCEKLQLRGRILISSHGINGTVGGEVADLKTYVKEMKIHSAFKDTTFKWSEGSRDDFPRISVRVRDEIVAFDATNELIVDKNGVVNGGTHLNPKEFHSLVEKRGDDVVFFDGRNSYEAAIGKFKNAVVPDIETSRDFIKEIESGKYESLKDKAVVTYCTGGIRCEILSSLMKNRGFKEVYQLDGGIVKYGEAYKDDGLWEGSLVVFDDRKKVEFSDSAKVIGTCTRCKGKTSNYENCLVAECNLRVLLCVECASDAMACRVHTTVHAI